jgi:hypothetical protein
LCVRRRLVRLVIPHAPPDVVLAGAPCLVCLSASRCRSTQGACREWRLGRGHTVRVALSASSRADPRKGGSARGRRLSLPSHRGCFSFRLFHFRREIQELLLLDLVKPATGYLTSSRPTDRSTPDDIVETSGSTSPLFVPAVPRSLPPTCPPSDSSGVVLFRLGVGPNRGCAGETAVLSRAEGRPVNRASFCTLELTPSRSSLLPAQRRVARV